jgi:transcriptional regulator with XRE-family HTH domain
MGRCRIPDLLNARGLIQMDIVNRTRLSPSTVSSYCTEVRPSIPLKNAILIAHVLGVTAEDLYDWEIVETE